jgi:hypothetical protein
VVTEPGTHVLTAKATNIDDVSAESAPVTVTVVPPTLTMTRPAPNSTITIPPLNVQLAVSYADFSGPLQSVTYYSNSSPTSIADSEKAPFEPIVTLTCPHLWGRTWCGRSRRTRTGFPRPRFPWVENP